MSRAGLTNWEERRARELKGSKGGGSCLQYSQHPSTDSRLWYALPCIPATEKVGLLKDYSGVIFRERKGRPPPGFVLANHVGGIISHFVDWEASGRCREFP